MTRALEVAQVLTVFWGAAGFLALLTIPQSVEPPARCSLRRIAISSAAVGTVLAAAGAAGLRTNASPSMPMGFYWVSPLGEGVPALGTNVCFDAVSPLAPATLGDALERGVLPRSWATQGLLKEVAALPGEQVDYHDHGDGSGTLHFGDRSVLVAALLEQDAHGRALPRPEFPVRLGRREVWLHSHHARSFDSRYFGPVDVGALDCRAEALCVR